MPFQCPLLPNHLKIERDHEKGLMTPNPQKPIESHWTENEGHMGDWRRSRPMGSCVVEAICKYTQTTEILWRKRGCVAAVQVREKAPWPQPGQAFIVFLGTLHRGRSSFTMHRFTTGDYLLRTTKDRTLLITSKTRMLQLKGEAAHTPYLGGWAQILGRWRYSVNICCLNSGWGSFGKSKSHSSQGTMQVWFPPREPIHGHGSCLLDLAPHWVFRGGAGPHFPHVEWFPIFSPLFLVRTAVDPTKLATCWSLTLPWENNLQMQQSTQSNTIISKQPVAPKTHILRLSSSNQFFWFSQPRLSQRVWKTSCLVRHWMSCSCWCNSSCSLNW